MGLPWSIVVLEPLKGFTTTPVPTLEARRVEAWCSHKSCVREGRTWEENDFTIVDTRKEKASGWESKRWCVGDVTVASSIREKNEETPIAALEKLEDYKYTRLKNQFVYISRYYFSRMELRAWSLTWEKLKIRPN